jgi:branched-chain amino acid transport system ATP-binding protein
MTMLRLEKIDAGYQSIRVLHQVDLEVPAGKVVALLGGNGAGKTTTLQAIAGLHSARSGTMIFKGRRIEGLPSHAVVRLGIALVPQARELFAEMTVLENLELGALALGSKADRPAVLGEVLSLFPRLDERRAQLAGTLSGGERAMLATGRAIMSRPSLLLLDEPTAGLAPLVVREVARALLRLKAAGQTILLVEQNIRMALGVADHVYVMRNGRIVADGDTRRFTDDDEIFRSYFA